MFAPSKNVFVKGDESPDEGGIHPTNVKIADANQQNQQGQKQNRPAEQGGSKFLVKGSSSTFGFKGLDRGSSGFGWF